MTTALYRRYRPDTFADVIGQDHVTGPLRAALRANKVTHAYLFSGPRGCGKTTSARILARCLNCAKGPTDTPCGSCDSCRELATGGAGSLDVVEIDAASHGGVDDARELREKATFAPVRDKYKIFIIDEAHMVTNQGFNALLKLVEEPPEHVKFVFATTEPERVIGTIRSRTHHYPFRLVPPDVLGPYLHRLAEEEHVHIAQGVLPMVMRSGGGSVRDTLSVLDQLMAGSIDNELSYETAVALLGYTDTALLDESIDALASGNGADAYRVIERMVESGHDPRRFVEDLLQRLRDLLIIAIAGEKAGDVLSDVPTDQFERMHRQATNWGAHGLSQAADLADEALRQMVGATSPRLQLELLIGRILLPPALPTALTSEEAADLAPSAGGSQEDAPQGRFGAREAREALERSRRVRAPERGGASERSTAGERGAAGDAPDVPAWLPAKDSPSDSAHHDWPEVAVPARDAQTRTQDLSETAAHASRPRSSQETEYQASVPQTSEPAAFPPHSDLPQTCAPTGSDQENANSQPNPALEAPQAATRAHSDQGADMIRERWSEVLSHLTSISRFVGTLVSANAQLGPIHGSELVLLFQHAGFVSQFSREDRVTAVSDAVFEVTGIRVTVSAQTWQAGTEPAITAPSSHVSAAPTSPASAQASPISTAPASPISAAPAPPASDLASQRGAFERAPQGQSEWVSEPPPFERDETPVAEDERPPSAPYPLDAGEDSPQDDTAERLHGLTPGPESTPEPTEPGFAHPGDAEITDPRISAPQPTSADPAQISDSLTEPPASSTPAEAPHSSAPTASETHVGYTNGPKRRAISVFTYDEPAPQNTPITFDSTSAPSREDPTREHVSAPDSQTASHSTPAMEAEADAWGPVAFPGGGTDQDDSEWTPDTSAPWSPDTSTPRNPEPAAAWSTDPAPSWEPADGAASAWDPRPSTPWEPQSSPAPASMSGWSESHATPTGVSFDDSSSPSTSGFDKNSRPRPSGGSHQAPSSSPAFDDSPSLDDEDVEVSTHFGVPAVLDILGGTVIEEIYDEGSR